MAYTKEQLQLIAQQLSGAYREAETEITTRLLEANLTDWQRARAAQQLAAIEDVLVELGEVTETWRETHVGNIYRESLAQADAALQAAGKQLPMEEFGALHTESIRIIGENLAVNLAETRVMVGRRVDDVFRRAGLNALQRATALGETRRQATQRLLDELTEGGISSFTDRAGKTWNLGTYAEMHARTTSMEATNLATENRMAEMGEDLVKISSHAGACPLCIPWEGKILSLSGASDEYPSVDEARAAGLFHPQCAHRPTPWIEGYSEIFEGKEQVA